MEEPADLEVATQFIRGVLRYHNTSALQVIFGLVDGLKRSCDVIAFDLANIGSMVIVDPDKETAWRRRKDELRAVLALNIALIDMIYAAADAAKNELGKQNGNP